MISYLKLVDFELKRFWKIYVFLLASVFIIQPITVLFRLNGRKETIQKNPLEDYYLATFTDGIFFYLPILICIATLVLYVFFTWYREWFGKSTFSIQLLLLPCNRMNMYYAKLTALLLFIFGCIVTQIGSYFIVYNIYKTVYPQFIDLNNSLVSWIQSTDMVYFIIPTNSIDFLLYYGLGIAVVIVLFTAILLERSFRIKGIIVAVVYVITCISSFYIPFYIHEKVIFLYDNEVIVVWVIIGICISVMSLWLSHYLMKKKIWV